VAKLDQTYGAVNVLVNNAAMFAWLALETLSVEDWDRLMAANVRSIFIGTKTVIPDMRAAGGGSVINMFQSPATNRVSRPTMAPQRGPYGCSQNLPRCSTGWRTSAATRYTPAS